FDAGTLAEVCCHDVCGPACFPYRRVLVPHFQDSVGGGEVLNQHPSPLCENRVLRGCFQQTETSRADSNLVDPIESLAYVSDDAWQDLVSAIDVVRPQAIPGPNSLHGCVRAISH